jgi:hypothetical protein
MKEKVFSYSVLKAFAKKKNKIKSKEAKPLRI